MPDDRDRRLINPSPVTAGDPGLTDKEIVMSAKIGIGISFRRMKRWALAGEIVVSARRADEIKRSAENDGKHWLVPQCVTVAENLRAVGQY